MKKADEQMTNNPGNMTNGNISHLDDNHTPIYAQNQVMFSSARDPQ